MGLFNTAEMAAMAGGVRVPAPTDYRLPDRFPSFQSAKCISIDLESHDPGLTKKIGPGWRRDAYIVGVSVALQDRGGEIGFSDYYPIAHKNGPNLDGSKVLEWLADELAFFSGEIVGANLLYDFDGFQYRGITAPFAKYRDVQWAEALLDESAHSYSLNGLAQKWLNEAKVTEELKILYGPTYIERFREIHPGHARAYGIGDVQLPLRILECQRKQLRKENLDDLFDLESRLTPMLLYMRKMGVRVDLDKAARLKETLLAKRDKALRECSERAGIELTAENFGKPSVLVHIFERLGIEYPYTDKGNPSIKDLWLQQLEDPFGKELALANRCDKAVGTFVDGYVTDYQINGRVHCELHPLRESDDDNEAARGTVTGRFSCNNPNLQNIPVRDEEIGPLCRAMFVPDEGMDFFSIDYSQIEYRLIVHYAVEMGKAGKLTLEAFAAAQAAQKMYQDDPKTDFHSAVALLTGLKRKDAKNLNFGLAYGQGVQKLAETLGKLGPDRKPTQEALGIMDIYHAKAPFIRELARLCSGEAAKQGYIVTYLNRRRRFELWEPKDTSGFKYRPMPLPKERCMAEYSLTERQVKRAMTHKALNAKIQGSAGGDMIKTAMVRIWESGLLDGDAVRIQLTVHDELDGSVAPGPRGQEALQEIKRIMEFTLPLEVPVLAESKIGRSWAETH